MRPDIAPAEGELAILGWLALASWGVLGAWYLHALYITRNDDNR